MVENLRAAFKLSVRLTVVHEEIKEAVIIVVPPGSPTATTRHQDLNTRAARHIGEGPIAITVVKIIRPFSHRITSGIDHIQIQVTVVIIVSPGRCAVIGDGPNTSLIGYVGKGAVSVILIKSLLSGVFVCAS